MRVNSGKLGRVDIEIGHARFPRRMLTIPLAYALLPRQAVARQKFVRFYHRRGQVEERDFAGARSLIDGKAVTEIERIGIARMDALCSIPVGERCQRKTERSSAGKGDFAVVPMASSEQLQHRK